MKKIVVIGGNGQLGQCLKSVSREKLLEISFFAQKDADITDYKSVGTCLKTEKPDYVINCAAYTAVDKAEDEPEKAAAINENGTANLAKLCSELGATLIHISTDFVFGGQIPNLLSEDDHTAPIGVYGLTKLNGEKKIHELLAQYFIIRTSWLYSEYGNNFVKTMLKFSCERENLNIVSDQVGSPTYAIDLANCILEIIEGDSRSYGIYHYSNEGLASWYDFTKAIFEISGIKMNVSPIKTSEYPTRAKRPAFSVMDKSKIKNTFNFQIPYWRTSLERCLTKLNENSII